MPSTPIKLIELAVNFFLENRKAISMQGCHHGGEQNCVRAVWWLKKGEKKLTTVESQGKKMKSRGNLGG